MAATGFHLTKGSPKPTFPDDEKLNLFSMRFCPFAHRVHLVLNAKQVPYRVAYINLSEKPEWLPEVNPLGKVPALQLPDNKGTLVESMIIAEYLDETYNATKPLFPKDPLRKAQDKILIDGFGAVAGIMYRICFVGEDNEKEAVANLLNGLDKYELELRKRSAIYFNGEQPGILDYMIWPWFERFESFQYLLPEGFTYDATRFKQLVQWRDLMLKDIVVQSHFLTGEQHAEYMRIYRTGKPDYNMLVKQ